MPDEAAAERIKLALYNVQVREFLALISKELQNPGVPVEVSISKLRSKLLEISDSCIPSKILLKKQARNITLIGLPFGFTMTVNRKRNY